MSKSLRMRLTLRIQRRFRHLFGCYQPIAGIEDCCVCGREFRVIG